MQKAISTANGGTSDFVRALHDGLSEPQKNIPSRFFYDANGSLLFAEITTLEEYYPTLTELSILEQNADQIAADAGQLPPRRIRFRFWFWFLQEDRDPS